MEAYLHAFGPMHQVKLDYAFNHLPEEFFEQPQINIIDYGCGQALGTMCYADFLRDSGCSQEINTITLIEPSEMCLKRASLHVSEFFPDVEIETVNKTFDEIDENDIYCDEDVPTLHILSNVLDMLCFDIDKFANLLNGCLKGNNQFVCVGPYFNYPDKDERMDDFCSYLNGETNYSEILDKFELNDDKSWTCQINVFSVCAEIRINNTFEQYKKLANKGDAKAQFSLGDCYYYGDGTSKDLNKAVFWYSKAADQCDADAQWSLGRCYERGEGVPQDPKKAAELYAKAKEQGLLFIIRL